MKVEKRVTQSMLKHVNKLESADTIAECLACIFNIFLLPVDACLFHSL